MEKVVAHVRRVVAQQGKFKPLFVTDIDEVLVRGPTPVRQTCERQTGRKIQVNAAFYV